MMRRRALAAAFLAGGFLHRPIAGPAGPDFVAASREATSLLQEYLRIDTSNPPGHERLAAEFLREVFERERIETRIIDLGHGRANIVARLPGSGGRRPIILLNHLDVVPADASRWTVPPFAGEIRDGYVWGRGATDMKGTAVCQLMALLLLKRGSVPLDRDVIFLGTADEEDGAEDGVQAMVERFRDALGGAEFVLTEGNSISVRDGETESWDVDVTEKSALWLRIVASGRAGHASIPEPEGAVPRLIGALSRILSFEPPVRVIPAVRSYFRELAKRETGDLRRALSDPDGAIKDPALRRLLLEDPYRSACLRATISVTGLRGSEKINVIPGEASAALDCRLLPGDEPDAFVAELVRVVGDPSLRFETQGAVERATESPTDTDLFRAILRARDRFDPGVPVLTPPLTSSTDATRLRQIGMVVYGFEPFRLSDDDDRSHGDDERLSVENVRFGLEVTYAVVSDVAAKR